MGPEKGKPVEVVVVGGESLGYGTSVVVEGAAMRGGEDGVGESDMLECGVGGCSLRRRDFIYPRERCELGVRLRGTWLETVGRSRSVGKTSKASLTWMMSQGEFLVGGLYV